MFLIILLGYAGVMIALATVFIVHEILTLAADEKAFERFNVADGKDFVERVTHEDDTPSSFTFGPLTKDELRDKFMTRQFPLRTYMDQSKKSHIEEIMLHLRSEVFGPSIADETTESTNM